ncbi:hypothetical protein [Amaricoccus solimangrovi]|uniref:Uncharacterized protein n=1 Tax=Amaricoccus solimangrovi TaxID=2589815 RepID=A0A501WXU2_9RHOB|nr:hypothetical protein [Amaricoccus solimangrovi]TPE53065.1 hypothetical protein FJM51_03300 [Amaricoccus solimangrovi]
MNRSTEMRRLTEAGWQAIPRGYLPPDALRRVERLIAECADERERILAEPKRPGKQKRER